MTRDLLKVAQPTELPRRGFIFNLTVSSLSQEGVFVLDGLQVDLGGHGGLRGDVVGQGHVEVADRGLGHFLPAGLGLPHEGDPPEGLGMRIFDLHVEGKPVLPESEEPEAELEAGSKNKPRQDEKVASIKILFQGYNLNQDVKNLQNQLGLR